MDAAVALAILEGLRDADRPEEYLEDEDPSITLPRRLGLSDVVGQGIRRYDVEARRGRRVPESEVADLVSLVIRRGDADEVFHDVGRALAARDPSRGLLRRVAPHALRMRLARREVKRRIRRLFGPGVARFERGSFQMVGLDVPFIDADPGGEVAEILTGLCEGIVENVTSRPATIRRLRASSPEGPTDRWEILDGPRDGEGSAVPPSSQELPVAGASADGEGDGPTGLDGGIGA